MRYDGPMSSDEAVSWPTGKPHVSFSELSDWIQCPFRHSLIHIRKLGSFTPTPHLSFGTGVHNANEHFIQTRELDKERAYDVIRKSWQENEELFMKGPFPDWASSGYGKLDDWIAKASRVLDDVPPFLDAQFPGWECFGAEELLYEAIQDQPISFKGFIDSILSVPGKGGKRLFWIIDWKTCGWGWRKDKRDDFNVQLQLILYKSFWSRKHQVPMKDIRCAFALLARDGKPGKSVSLVPVSVGPTTEGRGLKVIENHVRSVQRGMFLKNRNSCRFCEFENTEHCPADL